MGQWHTVSRFAKSLNEVKNDVSLHDVLQNEKELGWTDTDTYKYWLHRFKINCKKYINKKLIEFIPYNTYNNLDYKKRYGISMKANQKKNKNRQVKSPKNTRQEDYDIVLNVLLDELLGENSTKKERNNKVAEIINKIKKTKCSFSISYLCKLFGVSRSRFYDRKNGVGYKKRNDSKVDDIEYIVKVNEIYKEHKGRVGSDKIAGLINKTNNVKISQPTVNKIMNNSHLYVNSSSNKTLKYKEIKDTTKDFDYLVDFEARKNLKPYEAVSADFMIIRNNNKHYHLHMITDIRTHKILSYTLSDNQSADVVLKDLKNLPNVSIINTDHGRQYFDKDVKEYLLKNNIRQSMGIPGHSNDNLWIEYTFGRIREELFSQFDIERLSINYIKKLIDEYVHYWNNYRPIKKLGYMSPNEYINFLIERDCPIYLF
ncbi:IS3 family transposase [Mycoplasma hafezii]|uniref:IS3 family transposase n=1 Tax=Mycoplasma hafezii TaxID=525886 RepID=UPI003CEFC650